MSAGVVRAVRSLIVRAEFDSGMPEIGELVIVDNSERSPLLVESIINENTVLCLNIRGSYAIQKGMAINLTGKGIEIPVGDATIGRVLDALGQVIDGKPPITGTQTRNILRPPRRIADFKVSSPEILETGIKVIDFFAPFVKGRKVGIVGGAGVGKTVLTMELINNVSISKTGLAFFTGIGERIREGHELYRTLSDRDLLKNTCLFFGQMNENPVLRSLVGLASTTLAEYFRDEGKRDILFFVDNMYRFVQSRNELATILDYVPSEGGYQPTIFSDVKTLQDRLSSSENGSITSVQTIYVPADDLSDPAVQTIQRELDSVVVLSRKVAEQGIRPAVDLLKTSSSLLSKEIVGERHYNLSVAAQKLVQKYESLRTIIAIIGENELSPADRADFARAKELIQFFAQATHVTEHLDGKKGEYFTREQTLDGVEKIVSR